jgi:GxxExxY protein
LSVLLRKGIALDMEPPVVINEHEYGLIFKDEVFHIIGAAINVANILGCGFLEAIYQEALEIEFASNNIPFESQKKINISYKGKVLNKEYVADFICFDNIIVEIKAIKRITEIEEAQIINYLRATELPLGLVINFGSIKLEWKRYINKK